MPVTAAAAVNISPRDLTGFSNRTIHDLFSSSQSLSSDSATPTAQLVELNYPFIDPIHHVLNIFLLYGL